MRSQSLSQRAFRLPAALLAAGTILLVPVPASARNLANAQNQARDRGTRVPQTALSLCPALKVVSREEATPGTALAVPANGQFRLTYVQTTQGAEFTLLNRDSGDATRFDEVIPALPPGITWRILGAGFSPDGELLAIHSVGAIWVFDTLNARKIFTIPADHEAQIYPGKMSWSRRQLAVSFWPAESFLADVRVKRPVEVRLYDGETGEVAQRLQLPLFSADAWTELRISPDGRRLAVLERPRKWPGNARLALFETAKGKLLWQKKIGAEDFDWTNEGKQMVLLGSKLVWLDAERGKEIREAETEVPHSELQKLRINEDAQLGIGKFSQYSAFKRALGGSKKREMRVVLWQLDTGKEICGQPLDPAVSLDAWPTARDEIIALEETYDVRSPLRLLKSARIVVYRLISPDNPEKPASPEHPHVH
jgi:hypothetical protein